MAEHTHGRPVAWQKFGKQWCLVGPYAMRPVILSAGPKGDMQNRNATHDVLVPFSPEHEDSQRIVAAWNATLGIPTETLAALGEGGVKRLIDAARPLCDLWTGKQKCGAMEGLTLAMLSNELMPALVAALPKEQGDA